MATISTNVLALPLIQVQARIHNTESWVDSIKYLVGSDPDITLLPQLDLRGITFDMEVRRLPDLREVVLSASTDDGKLMIGEPPDVGFLIIQIPRAEIMGSLSSSGDYIADVRASDAEYTRVVIEMTLEIVEGITR
jgi:hypothetical protein